MPLTASRILYTSPGYAAACELSRLIVATWSATVKLVAAEGTGPQFTPGTRALELSIWLPTSEQRESINEIFIIDFILLTILSSRKSENPKKGGTRRALRIWIEARPGRRI